MTRIKSAFCITLTISLALLMATPMANAAANGRIAYVDCPRNTYNQCTGPEAIWVTPGVQLTHPGANEGDDLPAWSEDGKTIAFARYHQINEGGTLQYSIMKADADGSNERVYLTYMYPDGSNTELYNKRPTSILWLPGREDGALTGTWRDNSIGSYETIWYGSLTGFGLQGFDVGQEGFVHGCANLYPGQVACVIPPGESSGYRLLVEPAWVEELNYLGPVKWMSKYSSVNGRFVLESRGALYSIRTPQNRTYNSAFEFGTEIRRLTPDPGEVTCSYGGASSSISASDIMNPVPSPDGKYILAAETKNTLEVETYPYGGGEITSCVKSSNTSWVLLSETGARLGVAPLPDHSRSPAWQPNPETLIVRIDDGHDHQLHGLKVELRDWITQDLVGIEPVISPTGEYSFEDVPEGDYVVRATLDSAEFDIRYEWGSLYSYAAAWQEWKITIEPDGEPVIANLSFGPEDKRWVASFPEGEIQKERLDDMAAIFLNLRVFVDWVKANLTTDTGSKVQVHAYVWLHPWGIFTDGAAYSSVESAIYIDPEYSDYSNRDAPGDWKGLITSKEAPLNVEWHEYSHHLDAANRGLICSEPYVGHDGYKNMDTCNSMVEGIASFLPTMVTGDPDYAGITNHEAHTKAWAGSNGGQEDFAVSAILWDLVDSNADTYETSAVTNFGDLPENHIPVSYTDNIQLPLKTLWNLLGTEEPLLVSSLQQDLHALAGELTIDLNDDGLMDINEYDPIFLAHGFFPIDQEQQFHTGPGSGAPHYRIDDARMGGRSANSFVGLSSHSSIGANIPAKIPRYNHPVAESANIDFQVRDASGTPLYGAEATLTVHYPDLDQPIRRRLSSGESSLVYLELPSYSEDLTTDSSDLPACEPATDYSVNVTVTANINGYTSSDTPTFDNCEYAHAIAAATGPAALSYTLTFPEDSAAPVTSRRSFAYTPAISTSGSKPGSYSFNLSCSDPAVDNFASGCRNTEYRLDGGPLEKYRDEVTIKTLGQHVLEYRSIDAAANEEAFQSVEFFNVAADAYDASIAGFTPVSGPAGTLVTITGTNFGLGNGTIVTFNGVSATDWSTDSSTTISAIVPAGATTGPVAVTTLRNTATSAASFVVTPPPNAVIDIQPFDTANEVRPSSNNPIIVAVHSASVINGDTLDFDATLVDPATLKFGVGEAANIAVTPWVQDLDGDTDSDVMFAFRTQATGILCGDTEATLTGETYFGVAFTATDTVMTSDCLDMGCHP